MPTDGTPLLPGAEPFSAEGGPYGALALHGFTGSPHSVRPLAQVLADAGFTVRAPLLPGHGTSIDDMVATGWEDWFGAAEQAYLELADRVESVVLVGLSMGGTLSVALAADHPEVAGIVTVNPYIDPPAESFRELLQALLEQGFAVAPTAGAKDVAEPQAEEVGYEGTPLAPLLSLSEALERLAPRLAGVTCPLLIMTSRVDHVVPPVSSDVLAAGVSGPVERVWLERSFHVATLDADREEVERRTLEFANHVAREATTGP